MLCKGLVPRSTSSQPIPQFDTLYQDLLASCLFLVSCYPLSCPSDSPRGQGQHTKLQGVLHSTILMSPEARWSRVICGSVPRQATPPWSPLLSSKAQNSGRECVCWGQGGSPGPSLKPMGGWVPPTHTQGDQAGRCLEDVRLASCGAQGHASL